MILSTVISNLKKNAVSEEFDDLKEEEKKNIPAIKTKKCLRHLNMGVDLPLLGMIWMVSEGEIFFLKPYQGCSISSTFRKIALPSSVEDIAQTKDLFLELF